MNAGIAAAIVLVGVMAGGSAMATNGNDLLRSCQSAIRFSDTGVLDDGIGTGFCLGTMQAIEDLMSFISASLKPEHRVCLPKGVSNEQAARIVVKYLKENPSELNQDSSSLAVFALQDSYPCKK